MPRTKDHAYYRDLLEMHLEGEISPANRMLLFDHLEFCDDCRRTLQAEERLSERLKTVPKLVAPSDLRSSILKQAMQDRQDRATPIIEDKRLGPLLRGSIPEAAVENEEPADDLPVFAGIARPRKSRLRQTWRTASPYAAYAFVGVAATSALYTGAFRGVPGADHLQAMLRDGVRQVATMVTAHDGSATAVASNVNGAKPQPSTLR